jgi:transcriptional pleiotropic regulator of transition state genes
MTATPVGIYKVDNLGRIQIPSKVRDKLGITRDTPLEINPIGGQVVLSKYKPSCLFCEQTEGLIEKSGKLICGDCAKAIAEGRMY